MKVLLIEDDKFYARQVKNTLFKEFGAEVDIVSSVAQFHRQIDDPKAYDLVLYDIFLPDCYACDFIDELIGYGVPVLVITASDSEELFENYSKKKIIDFIIKSDMVRLDYMVMKLKILKFLHDKAVLIVEDTKSHFIYVRNFFKIYYPTAKILHATNIQETMDYLQKESVGLVITDYQLEKESGIDVVKRIREKYAKDEVGIIALTSSQEKTLIMRFLKSGANDFMKKDFDNHTFVSRIDNVVFNLVLFVQIRELAFKDYLTKCYTRRYLFEEGIKILKTLQRLAQEASVALCDLDHFKKVNDFYGHEAGDIVLIDFAEKVRQSLRSNDFIVRMGGEEFLIFFAGCDEQKAFEIVERRIRRAVEESVVVVDEQKITYDFSCGIAKVGKDLESAIKEADRKLYEAKEKRGRTIV